MDTSEGKCTTSRKCRGKFVSQLSKNYIETCFQNVGIFDKQKHRGEYDEMYIEKHIVADYQIVSMSLLGQFEINNSQR